MPTIPTPRRPTKHRPFWHGQEFPTPAAAHLAIRRWQATQPGVHQGTNYLVWNPNTSTVSCAAPCCTGESCCFKAIVQRQSQLPAVDPVDQSGFFAHWCFGHSPHCALATQATQTRYRVPSSSGVASMALEEKDLDPMAIDQPTTTTTVTPVRPRKRTTDSSTTTTPLGTPSRPTAPPNEAMYLETMVRHIHLLCSTPFSSTDSQASEMLSLAGQAYSSGVHPGTIARKLHDWLVSQGAPLPLWPPDPYYATPSPSGTSVRCGAPGSPHLATTASPVMTGPDSSPHWTNKRVRRWR